MLRGEWPSGLYNLCQVIFLKRSVTYNLRNANTFYFLWYIQLIMVLNQSDTEGSVFGTLFHRKLRILLLCNNSRIKSNIGTMKAATADFAGSIFLGSAFYSFYSFTPFSI